jgi:hypothetical protein
MADLMFMVFTLAFFAATWGLVVVCERLMESQP